MTPPRLDAYRERVRRTSSRLRITLQKHRNVLRVFGILLTLASFIFIGVRLASFDWSKLWNVGINKAACISAAVFFCSVLQFGLNAIAWGTILSGLSGRNHNIREIILLNGWTSVAKYIPGNFAQHLGRIYFGSRLDIRASDALKANGTEIGLVASVALLMAFGCNAGYLLRNVRLWMPAIAVLTLCVLTALFFFLRKMVWGGASAGDKGFTRVVQILKSAGIYAISLALAGWSFAVTVAIIIGAGWTFREIMISFGTFIISWTLGFLVPGAPAGLGIREATILLLLSPVYGQESVMAASFIHRLIVTIVDVIIFISAFIAGRQIFRQDFSRAATTGSRK
jgi:hypothetical protein